LRETSRILRWLGILFLFLVAVFVRLYRVDWDQHHFFHPDERAIGFAVDRLSFKPLQLNPHFFAYGSVTLYVIKAATSVLGRFKESLHGYDSSIFAGRVISALLGALTAVVLALLGTRLYGRRVGLLAGFLMATAVLHVQNSHFATSDVPLTFLVLVCLYFLVRILDTGRIRHYLLAGLFAGVAIATKFSALPILLPIGLTLLYRWWSVEARAPRVIGRGAMLGLLIAIGFFIGQPYAILDFHAFKSDILEQSRMVRNAGIFPYTNQYIGAPSTSL
jgi:4-amino-4-deoxy-L-arabinose transferase-like glycosyltransferase